MEKKIKYALITGGSSGIGMEFSKLLGKDGFSLIIVAKPQEELDRAKVWFDENMPEVSIVYRAQNLAVPNAAKEVYDFIKQKGYEIEVLINNAGYANFGPFQEIAIERELTMINLMVNTNYHLTRLFLGDMAARNSGKILLTSSTAAFIPGAKAGTYGGAKSFILFYGVSYNQELRDMGSDVSITVLCPPATRTGFAKKSGMDHLSLFTNPKSAMTYDADFVALKAYQAMKKGKFLVIPGTLMRIAMKVMSPMARPRYIKRMMKLGASMTN